MKKLIAVLAVMFSANAAAYVGSGNDNINNARGFLHVENNANRGTTEQLQQWSVWVGKVSGLASVYNERSYKFNVCYPDDSTNYQLAVIAANWLIEHPEMWADDLNVLVWTAHREAFGKQDENCPSS